MIDVGLQGAARSANDAAARRSAQRADRAAAGDDGGKPPMQGAGDPLHQQEDAGRPAEEDGARAARHRGHATTCRSSATRRRPASDSEAVFYFPGCGSERLFSQVGLATQAMLWHVGVQTRAAAGLPVLRLSAARRGPVRQGREDHHRQPRAVPPRRQHAQLPRHQDRGRVSCGTCYDQLQGYEFDKIFPGCRHHRHPRVPAREGRQARRRATACATCTTTPATRR